MSDTLPPPASPGPPNDAGSQHRRGRSSQWLRRVGLTRPFRLARNSTVSSVHEKRFAIKDSDWRQLREEIANLREPAPYLASVSWTCVGITIGALLTLLIWLPADSKLPSKPHMDYIYVTPLIIMVAIAGAVIAVFTLIVGHQTKQIRMTTVENVLADMDAIYRRYNHTEPGSGD